MLYILYVHEETTTSSWDIWVYVLSSLSYYNLEVL